MDVVEIKQIDNTKGNGLVALKDFDVGNVILKEAPLVCAQFSWNAAYGYEACEFCLRPLETAEENARRLTGKADLILPYPDCCNTNKMNITCCNDCGVKYCSMECFTKAYGQYHRLLCHRREPLNELNEAWKHIHYPPETSTIMLIPKIIASILQAPNRDEALGRFLAFCHRSTNEEAQLVHKFLGDKYINDVALLHELVCKSLPNEGVEQLLTPNGFQSLLALIGTNGQGVGTSPISQWVRKSSELMPANKELDQFIDKLYEDMDAHSGNFLNNEGVALYAMQSACNHNCVPNAEPAFLFNDSTLCLIALKPIKAGDEILISYLDDCSLGRSRHSRQKELRENYLFMCECEKCLQQVDEPDVTSDEDDDEEMSE